MMFVENETRVVRINDRGEVAIDGSVVEANTSNLKSLLHQENEIKTLLWSERSILSIRYINGLRHCMKLHVTKRQAQKLAS